MANFGKKKYKAGEAVQFMTRKQALKKLQLSLNEFRRLSIIKGIYPREPRNRKRAQKGDTRIKILYHKKDIQFLMHEPIIWKLREHKIFARKIDRARAMKEFKEMRRYLKKYPIIKLDHIVKERYPTFIDALKDLDDCLTLCFLFSTFPSIKHVHRDHSALCRRLTVEFMHAIIAAKALRKVFISIKGYYYQAEIKGQTITWIVPHHFGFEPQSKCEVDFKLMSIFVEFYIIMLGFVNYRLYHTLNLFYPPKFGDTIFSEKSLVDEQAFVSERISALNIPLVNLNSSVQNEEDELEIDSFTNETDNTKIEEAKAERAKIKKLKTLFKGLKFFVNREVPRESIVFTIRCFGGDVSWDKLLFVGSTYDENDETITHQIVDRPSMEKQFISRYYIQPQWIFDSVNARELLPVEKYFMGCMLPPHLSPFSDTRHDQTYIPPEERALMDPEYKLNYNKDEEMETESEDEVESEENTEDEKKGEIEDEEDISEDEEEEDEDEDKVLVVKDNEKSTKSSAGGINEKERLNQKKKMKVKSGEITKEDPWEKSRQERQEYRLREKLVKNKHRKLYKSMIKGREDRAKAIWLLRKKRRIHDETEKAKKIELRKAKRNENKT
ncbi:PREDICTED: pescadillo homolog [Ceratosolen solmsi marchali]|uniref:Pescadillo homolog n=1 Tax=Ceratosolen solmsi marchali TaxID=326594 RepID=A0AAJ6YC56_9HYME|nr:PREDICTED: pescadillo homolog [Ceratosolen solmsi marchali]